MKKAELLDLRHLLEIAPFAVLGLITSPPPRLRARRVRCGHALDAALSVGFASS